MAVTKTNFVRGNNLAVSDFEFDDTGDFISVKTDALSSVGQAIAVDASAVTAGRVNLSQGQVLGAGSKVIDTVFSRYVAVAASDIDVRSGDVFSCTVAGATTFTFSNPPAAGLTASFILELTNGGSAVVTWPAGTRWEGGTTPTLTAAGMDVLGFYTRDGGVNWRGIFLSKDNK